MFSDKVRNRTLTYFWIGYAVYIVSYCILVSAYPTKFYAICQLLGLIIFTYKTFGLLENYLENKYLKNIFILYMGWLVLTTLRGFIYNYQFVNHLLFDAKFGALPFAVPLILLFQKSVFFFKRLFDVIIAFSFIFISLDILFLNDLLSGDHASQVSQGLIENFSMFLGIPVGFLLLTFDYHSIFKKVVAMFTICVGLLLVIIRARRGLIFMYSSIIFLSFILELLYSKYRFALIFLTLIVATFLLIKMTNVQRINKGSMFSFLAERGDEDTRSEVEVFFYNDMRFEDWLWGKGINGKYFCPDIDEEDSTGYRTVIETGYLQIILRGGLVSIFLLLMIAIPAIIKGIFDSVNLLSKAAAIWIFLFLIYLYPTNVVIFSLNYFIFWISIGICYSKKIRHMPNSMIRNFFV